MTTNESASAATFPACPECGSTRIPPVSDAALCFAVDGGPERTIPRSQNAQLLRFLWRERGRKVVGDHLYLALGHCLQVSRAIDTLREKWKVPVLCDLVPKKTKAGTYGLFYLGEGVEVWEPGERAADGEA